MEFLLRCNLPGGKYASPDPKTLSIFLLCCDLYNACKFSIACADHSNTTIDNHWPGVVIHRCSDFTQDYWNFSNIGPFPGLPPFGIQYCTYITYPSQPILVSQGAVNIVIPVVFFGDKEMAFGTPPSTYPFGQSLARVLVTVTATDFEGAPIVPTVQSNPPVGNILCNSPVQTIGPLPPGTPTPPPTATASGKVTLFDFNSPQAAPGDAASGAQDTGNGAYGEIVIPLNVDWAISLLQFWVEVEQAVPGSDPEYTGRELPTECNGVCAIMQSWTNWAIFNTGNLGSQWFTAAQQEMQQELQLGSSQAVPAPGCLQAEGYLNCQCPLYEGVPASVLPAGAFQLKYIPLAIIYSGLGNKADPTFTVTQLSGTTAQLQSQTNIVNSNTLDDKTTLNGQLGISTGGNNSNSGGGGVNLGTSVSGSASWDTSIESSMGTQYGNQLTITNSTQLGNMMPNPFPPGWPSLSAATTDRSGRPFWNDLFVIAPNPQFLAWAYPGTGNNIIQPLGSEPYLTLNVGQLFACSSSQTPTQVTRPTINSPYPTLLFPKH